MSEDQTQDQKHFEFDITKRVEITDVPRDAMNQIPGIRQKLVQLRNSARLSPSKAAKLKETLQFFVDSLHDPASVEEEDAGAPVEPVSSPDTVPTPTAPAQAKKPVQKPKGTRRATAKVDKAKA